MQVGVVSWCVIPVSFNMKKMTLNASGCSVMVCDETSHVTCIPEVHRIYFSFESEDEEKYIFPTAQILLKTVTITCDSVKFHSPEVQVARRIGCLYKYDDSNSCMQVYSMPQC